MNQLAVLWITLVLLFSNNNQYLNKDAMYSGGGVHMNINVETGNYHDKNWNDTILTYTESAVPDKETAAMIANAIIQSMQKNGYIKGYILQEIFFDVADEIWILTYWKERDIYVDGDDCSIAIRKSNGEVLRIWFGE